MLLSIVALPSRVWGQGNLGNADDNLQNLQKGIGGNVPTDLTVVVGNVIKTVLSLVGIIFLVLTVYAGYLWMTARGEDEQVTKSKNIMGRAVIGLIILMAAYSITRFVVPRVLEGSVSTPTTPTPGATP